MQLNDASGSKKVDVVKDGLSELRTVTSSAIYIQHSIKCHDVLPYSEHVKKQEPNIKSSTFVICTP